jgi:hypothetical protein
MCRRRINLNSNMNFISFHVGGASLSRDVLTTIQRPSQDLGSLRSWCCIDVITDPRILYPLSSPSLS